jgi:hypothetical protein
MNTESVADLGRRRAQLAAARRSAELAFERAFDLQQAGAPAERVEAAMAEISRLQDSVRRLREQLNEEPVLQ